VDAFDFCKANGRALISFKTAGKQAELQTYLPAIISTCKYANYFVHLHLFEWFIEYLNFVDLLTADSLFTKIGFWTSGTYCKETSTTNIYCSSKNTWAWAATRENFGYVNWEMDQPDMINSPRDVCARAVPTTNYKWDDIDCGQFLPFICE